jgi:hypothetical protein
MVNDASKNKKDNIINYSNESNLNDKNKSIQKNYNIGDKNEFDSTIQVSNKKVV